MNDTCFGINNEGGLSFDYYHEDTDQVDGANVYNGQLSTLWVNFRQAFPDKIKETYQDLRSNSVLNYDEIVDQFINKGSNKWSESVYNEDGDFKYISMLRSNNDATNLPQVRGTGEEHLRYFLENRFNYCDSKWYAGEYISKYDPVTGDIVNNFVTLRIYTPVDESGNPRTDLVIPASADITITPYSHMYGGVRYKANGTLIQERLEANETYTFDAPNEVFNDTETAIYGAPQLSSLGDLAPLYLGYIDVGAATKLVELKIGDGTPGYQNNNLYHLAVGTNRLLKKIDIQNCAGFNQALVLTGCPNIEEVYAKGSSITGVELPDSGYLKVLQLPATITNLTLKNQLYIDDLTIEGYANLKTITIENCPVVNSLDILDKAVNVERVRLTNVDWHYDDVSLLYELIDRDIAGIDENGVNTDTMWIDGKCHIETLTGNELLEIKTLYPYLEITYTNLTSQLIYMSEDGQTELHRETIYNGGNGTNPVVNGTIETPTKESTAQYHYTFGGWSLTPNGEPNPDALKSVEADRTVYVAFNKAIRSYTVKFYNGTTLLYSTVVEYGSDATYIGSTPTNNSTGNTADFEFTGWSPSPTNIQGDTNCYAQYYDTRVITDDWATIAQACADGTATSKYAIGAYKNVDITYEDGTTETIPFEVIGHNHDELADGINKWEYVSDSTLPISFYRQSNVVYKNEIHIIQSGKHYKWNGSAWVEVSILPESFDAGNALAIVYNDEIHLIHNIGKLHYKWNETDGWIEVSTLPYQTNGSSAVVYNNEIHLIGGQQHPYTNHYKWNETDGWVKASTLPTGFTSSHAWSYNDVVVVYNNEIHIIYFNNSKHYKWDGASWTQIDTIPLKRVYMRGCVYNDCIHVVMGGSDDDINRRHYKWNDADGWTEVGLSPFNLTSSLFVYNNKLCMFGNSKIFEWSIPKFEQETLTANEMSKKYTQLSACCTFNDCIYFSYYNDQTGLNEIYKFNGESIRYVNGITHIKSTYEVRNPMFVYNNAIYYALYDSVTDTSNPCVILYKLIDSEFVEDIRINVTLSRHGSSVVYKGDVCFFSNGTYYILDWDTLTVHDAVAVTGIAGGGRLIEFNNAIYFLSDTSGKLRKYDGEVCSIVVDKTGIYSNYQPIYVVYDNKLYVILEGKCIIVDANDEFEILNNTDIGLWNMRSGLAGIIKERLYCGDMNGNCFKFTNPKATLTFLAKNLLSKPRAMNSSNNAGGWEAMSLRNYLQGEFINSLPNDLQTSIKDVIKISNTGCSGYSINKTMDKLWIPSLKETGITRNGILSEGDTYAIFTDNLSRQKMTLDGTKRTWWTRTSNRLGDYFMAIYGSGGTDVMNTKNANTYILPGFCI